MGILASGTTTISAGANVVLNSSPIAVASTDVVWCGAMGTDAISGVQVAPDGGAISGADGVTIVLEETATAGQVNLRATNLNGSVARTVRWKAFNG